MNAVVRHGAVTFLVLLFAACEYPVAPSPVIDSDPIEVLPSADFPALSGPGRVFLLERRLTEPVSRFTYPSRVALYENGAFALQYAGLGIEYRGTYAEANGVIDFDWEGWSTAGTWDATGTVDDHSLEIRFNVVMQMTDFEDAVYTLVMP